jgi:hypothetical protein
VSYLRASLSIECLSTVTCLRFGCNLTLNLAGVKVADSNRQKYQAAVKAAKAAVKAAIAAAKAAITDRSIRQHSVDRSIIVIL